MYFRFFRETRIEASTYQVISWRKKNDNNPLMTNQYLKNQSCFGACVFVPEEKRADEAIT